MGEYRFATPFFLLFDLTLFATLGLLLRSRSSPGRASASPAASAVASPAGSPAAPAVASPAAPAVASPVVSPAGSPARGARRARAAAFVVTGLAVLLVSVATYLPRSNSFAKDPTLPFTHISERFALTFNDYAEFLGVSDASLLCPDLGGPLCFSRLRVYDLAGLCDRKIARLIGRDPAALREYVLGDLRPTFIHTHDYWSVLTDFPADPRFRESYAPIVESRSTWAPRHGYGGEYFDGDYVRRDAVGDPRALEALRERLARARGPYPVLGAGRHPFPRG
jgi:hypothetical protein